MRYLKSNAFTFLAAFFGVLLMAQSCSWAESRALVKEMTVDAREEKGPYPDFLFGTLTSPIYSERAFELAGEAGFRMLEIKIDIDDMSERKLENFATSVKKARELRMHPLIWLLVTRPRIPDQGVLARNTARVLKTIKDIDMAYPYVIRVGNEPDNEGFWRGGKEEFFGAYASIAKEVKAFDPKYAVGGIALMNGCAFRRGQGLDCESYNDWLTAMLDYARSHGVPLDFITVHAYSGIGYKAFNRQFMKVVELVKAYPDLSPLYGTPKVGNDEWNILVGDVWSGSYHKQFDTQWTGASNVIAWAAMADNGLWLSVRYGGTSNDAMRGNGHDFPLTYADGRKKPAFYAFQQLNRLAGTKALRITGSDYVNFAAAAGRRDDGSVVIVMSNFDADRYFAEYPDTHPMKPLQREYQGMLAAMKKDSADRFDHFRLTLKGLAWKSGDKVVFELYEADERDGIRLVDTKEADGKSEMSFTGSISSPAVYSIKVFKK